MLQRLWQEMWMLVQAVLLPVLSQMRLLALPLVVKHSGGRLMHWAAVQS